MMNLLPWTTTITAGKINAGLFPQLLMAGAEAFVPTLLVYLQGRKGKDSDRFQSTGCEESF